jgi:uroporphyrinogen decarboxylase
MTFQPDYRNMLAVMENRRPERLPLYEHLINVPKMEEILETAFGELEAGSGSDLDEFFRQYCRFWREMTYDTVSFEECITTALPGIHALKGGKGQIQTRQDFEVFPWDEIPDLYWKMAQPKFEALRRQLPAGMHAVGGVGNGVFEISEDLVGFEYLAYMQADDPQLFADLYQRIGDLMVTIWQQFLNHYADFYVACRMGDDLGFKTGTLTSPRNIRKFILPQYARVIQLVRASGKPFLLHSCGNIFPVMDEIIDLGINAKHSNEDVIAPFDTWIERYGERIALLGGIDVDVLCRTDPQNIFEQVVERGTRFRQKARGFALGSGNSIPEFVPAEGYLAMIRAAEEIRKKEVLS